MIDRGFHGVKGLVNVRDHRVLDAAAAKQPVSFEQEVVIFLYLAIDALVGQSGVCRNQGAGISGRGKIFLYVPCYGQLVVHFEGLILIA